MIEKWLCHHWIVNKTKQHDVKGQEMIMQCAILQTVLLGNTACHTQMLSPSHFIPSLHLNSFLDYPQFILLSAACRALLLSVVAQATYDNGCLG